MLFFCPKKRKVQGKAENSFQYVLSVGASVFLTQKKNEFNWENVLFSPLEASLDFLSLNDSKQSFVLKSKESAKIYHSNAWMQRISELAMKNLDKNTDLLRM